MEKSARNAIFKGFFQNSLLGTFESKQTLRQQIKKQTFPKATFQRILRILLGNQVYHTEDAYRIAKGGALDQTTTRHLFNVSTLRLLMSSPHCSDWMTLISVSPCRLVSFGV